MKKKNIIIRNLIMNINLIRPVLHLILPLHRILHLQGRPLQGIPLIIYQLLIFPYLHLSEMEYDLLVTPMVTRNQIGNIDRHHP